MIRRIPRGLAIVMGVGLVLRTGFALRLAHLVWGDAAFMHADAWQYVNAATNLVDHGTYTCDPTYPDALFTRVPGYSLFWVPFYLVFGRATAYGAVAAAQVLIDTASIALVWAVTRALGGSERAALIAAGLFAVYPFEIFWVTPTAPDVLTMFFLLAMLLVTLRAPAGWKGAALVGALCAVAVLTREYLGMAIPGIGLFWLARRTSWRDFATHAVVGALAFVVVFSPWPLRNYLGHGRFILMRSDSSGSRFYERDMKAAIGWTLTWTADPGPALEAMETPGAHLDVAPGVFADAAEAARATALIERGRACGTGFHAWMHIAPPAHPCEGEVAHGFDTLTHSYVARHPIAGRLATPMADLIKTVFKGELTQAPTSGAKRLAVRVLFAGRTVLLLLGLGGLLRLWRDPRVWPIATFVLGMIVFLDFVLRGLQMRYLLQVDCVLLIPAGLLLDDVVTRWRARTQGATR